MPEGNGLHLGPWHGNPGYWDVPYPGFVKQGDSLAGTEVPMNDGGA